MSYLDYSPILVFCHSGIGDTIMSLPMLHKLHQARPEARIVCTVNAVSREILNMSGLSLEYIEWPKYWRRSPIHAVRGVLAARAHKPAVFICGAGGNLSLAGLAAWVCGAREKLGWQNSGIQSDRISRFVRRSFTHIVPMARHKHAVEQLLEIVEYFGVKVNQNIPAVTPSDKAIEAVCSRALEEIGIDLAKERYLTAHIGCEPLLRAKLLPVATMMRALEAVCRVRDMRCLLLWGPEDKDLVNRAREEAGDQSWFIPVPWNATLEESAILLNMAQALVTNDSGLMHLAGAVGTKVFAVFGPTDPVLVGPYGAGGIMLYRKTPCRPCFPGPNFAQCPHQRRCLEAIPVDALVMGVLRLLDGEFPSGEERIINDLYLAPSVFRTRQCTNLANGNSLDMGAGPLQHQSRPF